MRVFKPKMPERDPYAAIERMGEEVEPLELNALCGRLSRYGVEHSHGSRGPFHGLSFDSPHGKVSVIFGPGTIGYERGLLEAYCEGWDMSPRGCLTAVELYNTYMHGGWE